MVLPEEKRRRRGKKTIVNKKNKIERRERKNNSYNNFIDSTYLSLYLLLFSSRLGKLSKLYNTFLAKICCNCLRVSEGSNVLLGGGGSSLNRGDKYLDGT